MPEGGGAKSNLALRLLTAGVWGPFLLYLLYLAPPWGFPVTAAIVCALSAYELFAMAGPNDRVFQGWGVAASVAILYAMVQEPSVRGLITSIVAVTCLGLGLVLMRPQPIEGAALRSGWAVAGPFYMGGLFGAIVLLFKVEHGGSWVLLAMLAGFLSDTGGYFVGRAMGKRKLYELVSPKKTVEGAIGGLAGGLCGGLLAHFWFLPSLPLAHAVVLSIVAAAFGQLGDLCESLIKRGTGVKDSGTILPGHGGFLDRSDAMLFSAATVWLYVEWFGTLGGQ